MTAEEQEQIKKFLGITKWNSILNNIQCPSDKKEILKIYLRDVLFPSLYKRLRSVPTSNVAEETIKEVIFGNGQRAGVFQYSFQSDDTIEELKSSFTRLVKRAYFSQISPFRRENSNVSIDNYYPKVRDNHAEDNDIDNNNPEVQDDHTEDNDYNLNDWVLAFNHDDEKLYWGILRSIDKSSIKMNCAIIASLNNNGEHVWEVAGDTSPSTRTANGMLHNANSCGLGLVRPTLTNITGNISKPNSDTKSNSDIIWDDIIKTNPEYRYCKECKFNISSCSPPQKSDSLKVDKN